MTALAPVSNTSQPIAGPRFRAATKLRVDGRKRRTLLALLAAFADAGVNDPPMRELAARLGLPPRAIDGLLDRLEADGLLTIEWASHAAQRKPGRRGSDHQQRNRYQLGTWAP